MQRRLPAEWEEQDAILLAWPHEDTDWGPILDEVQGTYTQIVRAITRFEDVLIAARRTRVVADRLAAAGIPEERVHIWQVDLNDTWTRDFGPITVLDAGKCLLMDFTFNGWGMKFAAFDDNLVTRRLHAAGALGQTALRTVGLVLEGGGIDSDGRGTLLTTSHCLLQANRSPHLTRHEIEQILASELGVRRVLWLEHGYLAGDDTDSHVDTLARICPDDTIVYVRCDNPADEHYEDLSAMEAELAALRTADGRRFRLLPLPWPKAHFDEKGRRLPATYANFLIINGATLVPTYGDEPRDRAAMETIGQALPGREVVGVDCTPLIWQHGSLHCVTMQIPRGVLGTPTMKKARNAK
jgi:agmatine deiminase